MRKQSDMLQDNWDRFIKKTMSQGSRDLEGGM